MLIQSDTLHSYYRSVKICMKNSEAKNVSLTTKSIVNLAIFVLFLINGFDMHIDTGSTCTVKSAYHTVFDEALLYFAYTLKMC